MELQVNAPCSVELQVNTPCSVELQVNTPCSVELQVNTPCSVELQVNTPCSVELQVNTARDIIILDTSRSAPLRLLHITLTYVLRRRRFWHATLRLRSAIRHHPPQRAVLSQICCFGEHLWCCFRSCWTVLSHVMWGRPSCLLQSAGGKANRILLASALSSMRIICPNRISRRDWIIAVSLGCFVSLRTSSFRTNWYHLMPGSIRRHHWSSASILLAY